MRSLLFLLLMSSVCLADGYIRLPPASSSSASSGGTVTSVGLVAPVGYTASGSPVTSSGSLTLTLKASQAISASAIDWSAGNIFTKSIGSSATVFTFSNTTDGQTIVVAVTATSGSVTWPTTTWAGGSAPTQTANKTDIYTFIKIGSTFYGSVAANF